MDVCDFARGWMKEGDESWRWGRMMRIMGEAEKGQYNYQIQ